MDQNPCPTSTQAVDWRTIITGISEPEKSVCIGEKICTSSFIVLLHDQAVHEINHMNVQSHLDSAALTRLFSTCGTELETANTSVASFTVTNICSQVSVCSVVPLFHLPLSILSQEHSPSSLQVHSRTWWPKIYQCA